METSGLINKKIDYKEFMAYNKEQLKNHKDALFYLLLAVHDYLVDKDIEALVHVYNTITEVHPWDCEFVDDEVCNL